MFERLRAILVRPLVPHSQTQRAGDPVDELVAEALAIIRPQLKKLRMLPPDSWGDRRDYVFGYTVGVCRALCDLKESRESVGFEANIVTWAALTERLSPSQTEIAIVELVRQLRAQEPACLIAMKRGEGDVALFEENYVASGLIDAFEDKSAGSVTVSGESQNSFVAFADPATHSRSGSPAIPAP